MYDRDRHHLYWPRRNYVTGLEKQFRNLPCHVLDMAIVDHRELHATQSAPNKPSREHMQEIVNLHKQNLCLICRQEDVTDCRPDYEGTVEELVEIDAELRLLQAQQRELTLEMQITVEHRRRVVLLMMKRPPGNGPEAA